MDGCGQIVSISEEEDGGGNPAHAVPGGWELLLCWRGPPADVGPQDPQRPVQTFSDPLRKSSASESSGGTDERLNPRRGRPVSSRRQEGGETSVGGLNGPEEPQRRCPVALGSRKNDRQYSDYMAPAYMSGLPATRRRERTELHLT